MLVTVRLVKGARARARDQRSFLLIPSILNMWLYINFTILRPHYRGQLEMPPAIFVWCARVDGADKEQRAFCMPRDVQKSINSGSDCVSVPYSLRARALLSN